MRVTKEGKKCADTFNADNDTIIYYDCTTKPSPDGKQTEQEWCMIDPAEKPETPWDWCEPILDYNKVREKVRDLLAEEIPELRKIRDE